MIANWLFWFHGLKMYFSSFKFVDLGYSLLILLLLLIVTGSSVVANRWKCCINKAVRLETVHLFRWLYLKSLQSDQFTEVENQNKSLAVWKCSLHGTQLGRPCVVFPCPGQLWRLCWPWSVLLCLSSLLGPVWWHVCDRGQPVALCFVLVL